MANKSPEARPNSQTGSDELKQFIERIEHLEAEGRDIAEQKKEVYAEAKSRGYDTKVMRKVVAIRKRNKDEVAEEEAVLEMYLEALGMTFEPSIPSSGDDEDDEMV